MSEVKRERLDALVNGSMDFDAVQAVIGADWLLDSWGEGVAWAKAAEVAEAIQVDDDAIAKLEIIAQFEDEEDAEFDASV